MCRPIKSLRSVTNEAPGHDGSRELGKLRTNHSARRLIAEDKGRQLSEQRQAYRSHDWIIVGSVSQTTSLKE